MNIWEVDKLLVFIAFVIPGFVALKAYELMFPSVHRDSSKQIVDAVSYSSLNYAILFWPIMVVHQSNLDINSPYLYALFCFAVLFVSPVVLIYLWKRVRESSTLQSLAPHPTQKPWDYIFGQRKTYWVVVTLKNGKRIAGMFGENSFASSAPAEEQLYIEEEWVLNDEDGFERPAYQSAGVIILASEIETVEFYYSGDEIDEQEKN